MDVLVEGEMMGVRKGRIGGGRNDGGEKGTDWWRGKWWEWKMD